MVAPDGVRRSTGTPDGLPGNLSDVRNAESTVETSDSPRTSLQHMGTQEVPCRCKHGYTCYNCMGYVRVAHVIASKDGK